VKIIRRVAFVLALLGIIVCIVLLLNFTASNPTHRRYSSKTPLTTGQASGYDIGSDAERILSKDLGLPRNEQPDERQCICGVATAVPRTACNTCVVHLTTVDSYRRPDFVSSKFIAEAKNRQNLLVGDRDFAQIRDYADAAKALDMPLWVFVRVDTTVESEYREIVRSTGGDMVFYFTVPGYEDPTDAAAKKGILICSGVGIAAVVLEFKSRRAPRRPPQPAHARTEEILDDAEQLLYTIKSKVHTPHDPEDDT
jgi:hypothetical protein